MRAPSLARMMPSARSGPIQRVRNYTSPLCPIIVFMHLPPYTQRSLAPVSQVVDWLCHRRVAERDILQCTGSTVLGTPGEAHINVELEGGVKTTFPKRI